MLNTLPSERLIIKAVDVVKDKSGKMKVFSVPPVSAKLALPCEFQIAIGARVMLIVNLDVEDGLENGVTGTIKPIIKGGMPNGQPHTVCILFDDPIAGANARKAHPPPINVEQRCTIVRTHHETFSAGMKHVTRYQYPLKLTWAVTIHKVQGITVDSAVVSFEGVFQVGMAYDEVPKEVFVRGQPTFVRNKATPPNENLNLTVLSVCSDEDEQEFNLLCQIDGDTVAKFSCSRSILENMLPDDYDTEEHDLDEPLHDTIMQLLPAICSVFVSAKKKKKKKIIAVTQKLESLNE
ncbi:ATP-dependent DNA helicase PIF1 [Holothuria leucospilota]|uniref:ATP-dependent DNA helicase PIF1 n=1 Tax=Holothuria leucospilota TaxID=206669 RepID=A0A9Q1CEI8_HOLLE|nr:ATP-dependent DNA helicase PIF1 [Holothuria leucospilota]